VVAKRLYLGDGSNHGSTGVHGRIKRQDGDVGKPSTIKKGKVLREEVTVLKRL